MSASRRVDLYSDGSIGVHTGARAPLGWTDHTYRKLADAHPACDRIFFTDETKTGSLNYHLGMVRIDGYWKCDGGFNGYVKNGVKLVKELEHGDIDAPTF